MTELSTLIHERRLERGLSLAALAAAAGCSKAYLSGIENGCYPNPPSQGLLQSLEAALELPEGRLCRLAQWQATPEPIKAQLSRLRGELQSLRQRDAVVLRDGCVGVPLINKVAAGLPAEFTDLEMPVGVADESVPVPATVGRAAFAARIQGDSMHPTYRDGELVVFDPGLQPADGMDCLVRLLPDHTTTFKRIFFEPGDRLRLVPLNPTYEPLAVPLEQVSGLWPAVYAMRRV